VPPGDESLWTYPPFAGVVEDGALYGRGAADMKGAIACFAAAALDFTKAKGDEIPGSISLLITGDEEGPAINGTRKVLEWMAANGESTTSVAAVVGASTLPWTLKLINGFLIDRYTFLPMGRRRAWIIGAQGLIVLILLAGAALSTGGDGHG